MAFFRFLKMAAVRHLKFEKLKFFTAYTLWRANMCHLTKFYAARSNRCGINMIMLEWS